LHDVVESQKLSTEVYTKPSRVTELLTSYYHEMGYLDAAISAPRYELNADTRTGRVVFPVKEGPLYTVGEARFEGNTALSAAELRDTVPVRRRDTYRSVLRENASQRVREGYWGRGYNEVEVDVGLERASGAVNLDFRIQENGRGVVQDVVVEGNRLTST